VSGDGEQCASRVAAQQNSARFLRGGQQGARVWAAPRSKRRGRDVRPVNLVARLLWHVEGVDAQQQRIAAH